jgi:hypothetical protein
MACKMMLFLGKQGPSRSGSSGGVGRGLPCFALHGVRHTGCQKKSEI